MYDTVATATTSSYVGNHEIPLHHSSSDEGVLLSSLSLSAFMIQRPEPEVSFSWSDFPMVVKEDRTHTRYASSSLSSSLSLSSSSSSFGTDDNNSPPVWILGKTHVGPRTFVPTCKYKT
mmetsp:Transcript_24550/g.28426  ORF Transcript_24550/g.28426 Transcript_24550/m.28426 type:complete len:119 (-) Transcript_24550:500-856(-)